MRTQRDQRRRRIRARVRGTDRRPRAAVWRGNRSLTVQLIDDERACTLVAASSREVDVRGTKVEVAALVGKLLAARAAERGIRQVVFDRGGYRYHGRVRAAAEAMRAGGLDF